MALRAVVEVALHFESFRNVDLFHQGLYHLKARLSRDDEGIADGCHHTACPSGHLSCPQVSPEPAKKNAPRPDHHSLIPAHILEDQSTFSSRSFLIRYCEEEVELNDIGQFRIELGVDELEQGVALLLEMDLMFADLTKQGGVDRFGENPDVDSAEFKSVSTQQFRLRGAELGLHEFCPVVFDEFHFCIANMTVHSALLDFRLRLGRPCSTTAETLPAVPARSASKATVASSVSTSLGLTARCAPSPSPSVGEAGASDGSSLLAQAGRSPVLCLAEVLFGSADFALGARMEDRERLLHQAESFYVQHVDLLSASYSRMAAWLKHFSNECLTPAQRELLGLALETQEPQGSEPQGNEPQGGASGQRIVAKCPSVSGDSMSTASTDSGVPGGGGAHGTHSNFRRILETKLGRHVSSRSVAAHLVYEMNIASCRVFETWHEVLNMILWSPRAVSQSLRQVWERDVVSRWSASIVREAPRPDITFTEDVHLCESHHKMADDVRRAAAENAPEPPAVEDLSLQPRMDLRPLLFEERCAPRGAREAVADAQREAFDQVPCAPKPYRGVHLFVLVHGFQGNSFDMRLMKNNLALLYSDAIFLCSTSNEDNTEGDINEMGIRLAQEVVNYICDWCPNSALGRLSFVAHSMGGLIARAALPLLHEYSSKMWTFLTFSTSHLGIFQDKMTLFNTGFWVLKNWRKSQFLDQISMADHADPRETFLYKLSKSKGLEFFKNVLLVSCVDDQYGPYRSARAEICSEWKNEPDKKIYIEMVRNIWGPVEPEAVTRFDVNFVMPEKNLDTFIGRAAHIQFLECQPIMKMIIHNYSAFFR